MYRLTFGPNGYNNLPNIISLETSACLGDPAKATWTTVNGGRTDWLPPIVVQAIYDGDGGRIVYTGGNHGASGDASGGQTAVNTMYHLLADNLPLQDGDSGAAQCVTALIVNELMAYNTITRCRYVVRQTFRVDIRAGSVEVNACIKALENVDVLIDNGLQMVTTGYQDSVLFYGGELTSPTPFAQGLTSGPSSTYRAWAAEFQSSANGLQVSWMDRSLGAGDGRYVAPTSPFIFIGGTTTKCYHAVVAGQRLSLDAGEEYSWRGGYAWKAPVETSALRDGYFPAPRETNQ